MDWIWIGNSLLLGEALAMTNTDSLIYCRFNKSLFSIFEERSMIMIFSQNGKDNFGDCLIENKLYSNGIISQELQTGFQQESRRTGKDKLLLTLAAAGGTYFISRSYGAEKIVQ